VHGVHPYYTEFLAKHYDFAKIDDILDKYGSKLPISYDEKALIEVLEKAVD